MLVTTLEASLRELSFIKFKDFNPLFGKWCQLYLENINDILINKQFLYLREYTNTSFLTN